MGLSNAQLRDHLDAVAAEDPVVAGALDGHPAIRRRIRPTGYRTLLRTIVGQQVSVASADAVWGKLEAELGEDMQADELLARDFDTLRACGFRGRNRVMPACANWSPAMNWTSSLPADDEEAIAELVRIKGIGRWSAEIYLLFAEGRPDIWPAGDLAVQEAVGRMLTLSARPSEKETREIGAAGSLIAGPWRSSPGTPIQMQRCDARTGGNSMSDRKAIYITGCGSGIGRAVALHFAERGWFVGLGDIDKTGLHETAELIGNGFVYTHLHDVRDRVGRSARSVLGRDRRPHRCPVQQRGYPAGRIMIENSPEIERCLDINLKGVLFGAQAATPICRRRRPGRACSTLRALPASMERPAPASTRRPNSAFAP